MLHERLSVISKSVILNWSAILQGTIVGHLKLVMLKDLNESSSLNDHLVLQEKHSLKLLNYYFFLSCKRTSI